MDAGFSRPGEAIADIHAFLRLRDSCVGRGFQDQVCTGYGDACDGTSPHGLHGRPRDATSGHACDLPTASPGSLRASRPSSAPAGAARLPGEGGPAPAAARPLRGHDRRGETAFDLALRDLRRPPFGLDANTAHELATRLFTIARGPGHRAGTPARSAAAAPPPAATCSSSPPTTTTATSTTARPT